MKEIYIVKRILKGGEHTEDVCAFVKKKDATDLTAADENLVVGVLSPIPLYEDISDYEVDQRYRKKSQEKQ